jgi:glyoxylase-like metal-dependent hydrolase (beta-lactamase superfamily II)
VVCIGPWGRTQTNVYLVRDTPGWVLVDTGWAGDADRIESATRQMIEDASWPQAILLTHAHPDHSGAVRELADRWSCPVFLHPDELPIANGDFEAMREVAGPLDRWVVLTAMRAIGGRRRDALLARNTLGDAARPLRPGEPVPGLPGWEVVATPGHTPGHVSLFRPADRVLLAGDALVNLRLNSVSGLLRQRPGLSGPPWYTTWNRAAAVSAVKRLAALCPRVLGPGHGRPLTGPDTLRRVQDFAARLDSRAAQMIAGSQGGT